MNKSEQIVKLTHDLSEADRIIGRQAREIRRLNSSVVDQVELNERLLRASKGKASS